MRMCPCIDKQPNIRVQTSSRIENIFHGETNAETELNLNFSPIKFTAGYTDTNICMLDPEPL